MPAAQPAAQPAAGDFHLSLALLVAEHVATDPKGFTAVGAGIHTITAVSVAGGTAPVATFGLGATITLTGSPARPDAADATVEVVGPNGAPHKLAHVPLRPNDPAGPNQTAVYRIALNPTIDGQPGTWKAVVTVTIAGQPHRAEAPIEILAAPGAATPPADLPPTGHHGLYL